MIYTKPVWKLLLLCLILTQNAFAWQGWDISKPPGDLKTVNFTTTEGTWMNLDVSPDGKTIVFDMLGDIYQLPISGGKATSLTSGLSWDVQPRFSPDGQHISFTSDQGGGDNIWVMKADGSEHKAVTKEKFRLLNNAVWTPDGQYLIARKHYTSQRSLGAGELWMYHHSGGQTGIQLTKRKNDQQDAGEPWASPDGRYVYFSEDMSGGRSFEYNKDPNKQIYVIRRYDRDKGEIDNITGGGGSAFRPQLSPDGKLLAFVRRVRTKSVLYIHELATGVEYPVYDALSKDQQEAWAIFGVYSNFNWLPDNKHLVIWAKGKLWKVSIEARTASEIPFEVDVERQLQQTVHFEQPTFEEKFTARAIRHARSSPDGKTLVFNAAGYLWIKKLPNGKPKRLTNGTDFEFEPAFSQDGTSLTYVTWSDQNKGALMSLSLTQRNASPQKLTTEKGLYRTPAFSPDGKLVVYTKSTGNIEMGYSHAHKPGIYTVPANGGAATFVQKGGEYPIFNTTGDRIYYQTGGYYFGALDKGFHSVDLGGNDHKQHFKSTYANRFVPSPDGRWIAFNELHHVYIAPFPKVGEPVTLTGSTRAIPVSRVSKDAGVSIHWSGDSKQLHWTLGEEYFSAAVKDHFTFLEGSPEKPKSPPATGLRIGLELTADKPEGLIALTNARIITMRGEEVIEEGTLLVRDNEIEALGTDITVPASATVIDCQGKTIIPGLVDAHAHMGTFGNGLSPQQSWAYYANLAYGVTTTHDPSSNTELTFSQSEAVKAGHMTGPRIYSTGIILYGADGDFKAPIDSLGDALRHLRRTKAFGAFSVKSYNQPRRDQRQQVIEAARQLNMHVYPEGGSTFFTNLTQVVDGHTGIEHNLPVAPLYGDVINLWKETQTGYTPTLIVNYGGNSGEYYWYQHTNVWEKEHLLTYTPRAVVDPRARRVTQVPEEEYVNGHILVSQSCKKLSDAGVRVNMGAHGQLQGLGAHWEMWMLAQGGMSPLEALRSSTLWPAWYIGMDKEIGSLEVGKLADLVILDKNPLEDIRNTEFVSHTMINGRLYDVKDMRQIAPEQSERQPFFWEAPGYSEAFDWHLTGKGPTHKVCACGRH